MKKVFKTTIALTTVVLAVRANVEMNKFNRKLSNFTAVNRGEHNLLSNKVTCIEKDISEFNIDSKNGKNINQMSRWRSQI